MPLQTQAGRAWDSTVTSIEEGWWLAWEALWRLLEGPLWSYPGCVSCVRVPLKDGGHTGELTDQRF